MKSLVHQFLVITFSLTVGFFCGFQRRESSPPVAVPSASQTSGWFSPDFGRELCLLREVYEWKTSPEDGSIMSWIPVETELQPFPVGNFYALKQSPAIPEIGDREIEYFIEEDHWFTGTLHGLSEERTSKEQWTDPKPGDRRARDSLVVRRWNIKD